MIKKLSISVVWAVLGLVAVSLPFAYAEAQDGEIIYIKGQVKLQGAQETQWVVAKEGDAIKDGDKIKTSKFSAVEIAMDKDAKNVVRVEQESEFIFESITAKKANLANGKIYALLESLTPGSSFEVSTPTAVCGVAGSGMFVHTDGIKTTTGCHEDKSYVKGINQDGSLMQEKIIEHGYKCVIEKFKEPGALTALTGAEQREWSGFRDALREHLEWGRSEKPSDSRKVIDRIKKLQDNSDKRGEIQREDRLEKREKERLDTTSTGIGNSG